MIVAIGLVDLLFRERRSALSLALVQELYQYNHWLEIKHTAMSVQMSSLTVDNANTSVKLSCSPFVIWICLYQPAFPSSVSLYGASLKVVLRKV